jgi:hypothetical protein
MKISTIGIDLAKAVFQIHGVNAQGKVMLKKQLRREQMMAFFTSLVPCLIGMEACGSAHHWARKLQALGHTVKLMAPQFVKPWRARRTQRLGSGRTAMWRAADHPHRGRQSARSRIVLAPDRRGAGHAERWWIGRAVGVGQHNVAGGA